MANKHKRLIRQAPLGPNRIQPLVDTFTDALSWFPGTNGLVDRVGAASRSLQLACQQVATMPLRLHGSYAPPLWMVNPDPASYNGLTDALFVAVWCHYLRGDAFLWVTSRYADGFPATWVALDPVTMHVEQLPDGTKSYRSNGAELSSADVLQITRNPSASASRGTGVFDAYWSNMASAYASETYSGTYLSRSGVPGAVLRYEGRLNEQQALDLQTAWVNAVSSRMGAPAVLTEGLSFQVLSFSPKDLMLLELREYDAKQIASAVGVPAFLLNLPQADGLNYSNPAMLFDLWWKAELMPVATRFEQAFSRWLPRGSWVSFDPSAILRPDFAAYAATWLTLHAAGVVTTDEVRAAVTNLPPLPDGAQVPALVPAAAG
jgi:HK97 family phage portal protein